MTTFFVRRSVEKAFQLDEQPSGLTLNRHKPLKADPPFITSAVDDIMYIVNKVLQQSLATSQIQVVSNVVPTLSRVLGSDFIGMTQRRMRDEHYPKPVVQGGQPPEQTVISFLVLINNLDVAVDYIRRIVQNNTETKHSITGPDGVTEETDQLHSLFPVSSEAATASQTMQSLSSSFESKVNDLLSDGIQVIFNNVIKHRLRPILADAFRDIEYQPRSATDPIISTTIHYDHHDPDVVGTVLVDQGLDEEEDYYPDSNREELVHPRFAAAWSDLLVPIARILTPSALDRLLTVTLAYLARLLEKRLWSYQGRVNVLGATRLERDVSGIVSAAVDVSSGGGGGGGSGAGIGGGGAGGRYRHREAFARCLQMVLVMGMEDDEWEDVLVGEGEMGEVVDKLSREEMVRVRGVVRRE